MWILKINWKWLCVYCVVIILVNLVTPSNGYMVGENPFHQKLFLDSKGKYELEWLIEMDKKLVTFNITVETKGYIGFGLSSKGKMSGADVVLGGVLSNGEVYFSDRHAVGNYLPEIDVRQDWMVHCGWETGTHTFLSIYRLLDTCDSEDYQITEDKITLMWAYGEEDNGFEYHYQNRGVYNAYLLHPNFAPQIPPNLPENDLVPINNREAIRTWTVKTSLEISSNDTTYWCHLVKGPHLHKKHHLIGFETRFPTEEDKKHVHHVILRRCIHPKSPDETRKTFDPFINGKGQQCYNIRRPNGPIPTQYCTDLFTMWAIGGRPFFHPPHVGIPMGLSPDEYFNIQIHYDNSQRRSNLVVEAELKFYYTNQLRKHEGGLMIFGHDFPGMTPSFLIPPSSINYEIQGYCGTPCTKTMLPPEGITAYAVKLHTHNSGKQVLVRHFRQSQELPWLSKDANYDNQFQTFRVLPQETKLLPGDQFLVKCTYDNTWTNGSVVGGFSSRQEMCQATIFYYNRVPAYSTCTSEILSEEGRKDFLNVANVSWSNGDIEYLVNDPHPLHGLPITELSDHHVEWGGEKRERLQSFHLYHPHSNKCLSANDWTGHNIPTWDPDKVNLYKGSSYYPVKTREYKPPPRPCYLMY